MPRKAALGLTFVRFLMGINQANQWWFPLRNTGFHVLPESGFLETRISKYFDEVNEVPVIYHWKYKMDNFGKEDISLAN